MAFQVRSVSVVVTAQSHNPSVLTGQFLVSSGVVPDDWGIAESVNIPPFSLVRFQNGVQWTLDESRLIVTAGGESSLEDSYQIHDSVIRYLHKVSYVPYRSLGLNWVMYMEADNPDEWLMTRFLKDGPWMNRDYQLISMIPRFVFSTDNAVLNLAFSNQVVSPGQSVSAVSVDCNVHHEGPLNATELIEAIGQWKSRQTLITSTLDVLSMDQ